MANIVRVSPDYANASATVSLLSVVVLIFLFFYLNWYTGRRYFSVWTMGWTFYAAWLALGPAVTNVSPWEVMIKHWCVGASAALLFWGSVQFLKLPSRPMLFSLFLGFLLAWSYVGAFFLKNPLQIRAPIFGIIGLASLVTAYSFYRLRKHREFLGAGLLTFGFALWGIYLGSCSFLLSRSDLAGTGFLISAVLQLFIAVSMIILVLEEARAANELILKQIRSSHLETHLLEHKPVDETQYQGVFDREFLGEQLREAREALRQAQETGLQRERFQALAQMSRGIAHDINNALTPILGYSNLLLRQPDGMSEENLAFVRSIKTAGEKISQSVACIRDFYRKHDSKDVLLETELNGIAHAAMNECHAHWHELASAGGPDIAFSEELGPSLPRIMGKQDELAGALKQLLNNALEAMPDGGTIRLRTGVRPAASARSEETRVDKVFVEVVDTGLGMDDETRRRCLEPFFSTKDQQGAKGLGLSRVFGIVQRHQGQIEIESRLGRGTAVRLLFPALRSSSTEMIFPAVKAAPLPRLKILCIDDEPAVLNVLKLVLKDGGHAVETAGDGQSGLEAFRAARVRNEPFDVIVTDFGMPRMNGRGVATAVKSESAKTPVILLTGWGGIMQAEGEQPENIDVVLSKPPQMNELIGALHKVTGK